MLNTILQELPVPLFTYENYNKLIEIANISSMILHLTLKLKSYENSGDNEMLKQLKMILVVIPPAHIDMLKLLLPSLKRFSDNSAVHLDLFLFLFLLFIFIYIFICAQIEVYIFCLFSSQVNMMTTSNLAIVFGPSLIRPQVDNFETVLHVANISRLTTMLIEHNINLFEYV